MKNRLFLVLCFALSSLANADVWSGNTTITQIYAVETSGLTFMTEYSNPISNCDGGRRFNLNHNLARYDTQGCSIKIKRFRVFP